MHPLRPRRGGRQRLRPQLGQHLLQQGRQLPGHADVHRPARPDADGGLPERE